jgi:hypothetical protein
MMLIQAYLADIALLIKDDMSRNLADIAHEAQDPILAKAGMRHRSEGVSHPDHEIVSELSE